MGACYFCDRLRNVKEWEGRLIYEDDLIHVTHQINNEGLSYLGAVLIQTKRHTEGGLAGLTDAEAQRIGLLVAQISRGLKDLVGAAWTYTYCFTESFRHVHQFVLARYPGTPPEYIRLQVDEWKQAPRGSTEQISKLSHQLAARLRIPSFSS
jgi:diadenosine tetraphosphate (Ap4A) HIT family hydrolase